jgi:hypothetical protein
VVPVPLPFGLGGFVIPIAHVSPIKAAGTVQFKDGDNNLDGPKRVIAGTVFGPLTSLQAGPHSVKAVFIPTNPNAFQPSTSNTANVTF